MSIADPKSTTWTTWDDLAEQVLDGYELTPADALAVLAAPDEELLDLMAAA